jgi:hypothetical protein
LKPQGLEFRFKLQYWGKKKILRTTAHTQSAGSTSVKNHHSINLLRGETSDFTWWKPTRIDEKTQFSDPQNRDQGGPLCLPVL